MRNEGTADRVIRVILGIALLVGAWMGLGLATGDILGIVAAAIAGILILTGLVGFCPAYRLVGLRTCSTKHTP